MKKIIIFIACMLGFAQAAYQSQFRDTNKGIFVNVEDLYENFNINHVFALNFTVQNNSSEIKTVRIQYPLPRDGGKMYRFNRTIPNDLVVKSVGRNDIYPLKGGIVTLAQDETTGRFSLDIMYKQNPGMNKFTIVVNHFDESNMNRADVEQMTVLVNPKDTPLKNKIIRHYEGHRRFEEIQKPRKGDKFLATVIHGNAKEEERLINGQRQKVKVYDFNAWNTGSVHANNIEEKVEVETILDLHVPSFGTIKDTRMVNTDLGELADDLGFNESTFDGHMSFCNFSDERDIMMGRCWANGIFNIYNYYYGNQNDKKDAITQDELVYLAKTECDNKAKVNRKVFETFGVSGTTGSSDEVSLCLFKKAIANVNPVLHNNHPTEQEIIDFISEQLPMRKRRPLWISMSIDDKNPGHVMLIDGVAKITDMKGMYSTGKTKDEEGYVGVGTTLFHLVNLDNYGISGYVTAENIIKRIHRYITYDFPDNSTKYIKTNPLVSQDTDGDGLVDFDEAYRFNTGVGDPDTDGDHISDIDEIRSYVLRTKLNTNAVAYQINAPALFAVGDGYGRRPENDESRDFDNDGYKDGEEDRNHNGLYEPEKGERDPLINESLQEDDESSKPFVPSGLTFYALSEVRVNDGTVCYSENGLAKDSRDGKEHHCNVASESTRKNFSTFIGARTKVKNIYSKGGVQLRSNAKADKIFIYKVANFDDIEKQDGVSFDESHLHYPYLSSWDFDKQYKKNIDKCDEGSEYRTVRGEETLENGAKYRMLKVESNGVLTIYPGTMCVGDLQIESGATIKFSDLDFSTELYVNKNVIWRGKLDTKGTSMETIAKKFLLALQTNNHVYIDSKWAGSIYAPKASIVLAQTQESKTLYGQFLAKNITVHQNATVYTFSYKRNLPATRVLTKKRVFAENSEGSVLGNTKILNLSRNSISFEAGEEGTYEITITKANGEKIVKMDIPNAQPGLNSIPWNSENVVAGVYIVTIQHNSITEGKKVLLR